LTLKEKVEQVTKFFQAIFVVRKKSLNDKSPSDVAAILIDFYGGCLPPLYHREGKVSETTDQALGLLKVNFVPSGLVSIISAPDPSKHDDPSMNSVHSSCGVSITDASGGVSPGFSTRKSARIWPFIDVRGRYVILGYPSMTLHFCNRPATSGCDITCLMGWSVMTTMGCAWKYLCKLLAAQSSVRTSFSIGSGKDFSANLEMNLFRLASFPLRLWTSLISWGWEL
nr:hypothetical protein [Tanacetum cinerariifolium]